MSSPVTDTPPAAVAVPFPPEPEDSIAIIRLNVGGTRFVTTRTTLEKYPDSYFGLLLRSIDHCSSLLYTKDSEIFIDRDPAPFEKVLTYLRTNKVFPPMDARLRHEFQFYGLPTEPLKPPPNDFERYIKERVETHPEESFVYLKGKTPPNWDLARTQKEQGEAYYHACRKILDELDVPTTSQWFVARCLEVSPSWHTTYPKMKETDWILMFPKTKKGRAILSFLKCPKDTVRDLMKKRGSLRLSEAGHPPSTALATHSKEAELRKEDKRARSSHSTAASASHSGRRETVLTRIGKIRNRRATSPKEP